MTGQCGGGNFQLCSPDNASSKVRKQIDWFVFLSGSSLVPLSLGRNNCNAVQEQQQLEGLSGLSTVINFGLSLNIRGEIV
jgi:hypothetical protein